MRGTGRKELHRTYHVGRSHLSATEPTRPSNGEATPVAAPGASVKALYDARDAAYRTTRRSLMDYPADITDNHGHARIHQGHGLDHAAMRADLDDYYPLDGIQEITTEEVWLRYQPRVKWCDRIDGFGCDMNGEWHGHWSEVRAGTPGCAFTIARPLRAAALGGEVTG